MTSETIQPQRQLVPFGKSALAGQRSGNRQAVFLRQAQQQCGIQRVIHTVTHQAGNVQPAQQIIIQHLLQRLLVDRRFTALWRTLWAGFIIAGYRFLLHIDRHA
ncbi:hypothetical protein D3C80_1613910 [compost metagenome]